MYSVRVVEPNINKPKEPQKKSGKKSSFLIFAFVLAVSGITYFLFVDTNESNQNTISLQSDPQDVLNKDIEVDDTSDTQETPTGVLLTFSGKEFQTLYDNLVQPNLERVDTPPAISGNQIADTRIREIAESRGYKLRSSPTVVLSTVQGYQLQEAVHRYWLDMQNEAAKDGISMSITSAYRSVESQRGIFLRRLSATGASIEQVAAGNANQQVDSVLVTSSIPGYSKHHTGYTIDILCAGYVLDNFGESPCFDWISANNYEKAKTYGFIPSYPPDTELQGPDPEAWEYVWVGTDLLKN